MVKSDHSLRPLNQYDPFVISGFRLSFLWKTGLGFYRMMLKSAKKPTNRAIGDPPKGPYWLLFTVSCSSDIPLHRDHVNASSLTLHLMKQGEAIILLILSNPCWFQVGSAKPILSIFLMPIMPSLAWLSWRVYGIAPLQWQPCSSYINVRITALIPEVMQSSRCDPPRLPQPDQKLYGKTQRPRQQTHWPSNTQDA